MKKWTKGELFVFILQLILLTLGTNKDIVEFVLDYSIYAVRYIIYRHPRKFRICYLIFYFTVFFLMAAGAIIPAIEFLLDIEEVLHGSGTVKEYLNNIKHLADMTEPPEIDMPEFENLEIFEEETPEKQKKAASSFKRVLVTGGVILIFFGGCMALSLPYIR